VIFKPDSDDRLALLDDDRFYSPPYWGPSGWLALDRSCSGSLAVHAACARLPCSPAPLRFAARPT
jgi:hypothetical protein